MMRAYPEDYLDVYKRQPQLYAEGTQSGIFRYHGKQIGVLLCGDGWTDEVVSAMISRQPDLVCGPVYVLSLIHI